MFPILIFLYGVEKYNPLNSAAGHGIWKPGEQAVPQKTEQRKVLTFFHVICHWVADLIQQWTNIFCSHFFCCYCANQSLFVLLHFISITNFNFRRTFNCLISSHHEQAKFLYSFWWSIVVFTFYPLIFPFGIQSTKSSSFQSCSTSFALE